jgi:hypothetical protein
MQWWIRSAGLGKIHTLDSHTSLSGKVAALEAAGATPRTFDRLAELTRLDTKIWEAAQARASAAASRS